MKRLKWWMGLLVAGVAVVFGAGSAKAGTGTEAARGMQKLVFNANGGTCKTGYDYYTQGEPYTFLPEAVWSGHEFLGWFTAASGGVQVTEAQTVTSASTRTLYAHWTPDSASPTMQKLIFNANGGTCNTSWDWYTVGQPYTYLPEANRSGYVLAGWFTAASGGVQVTEAQTVTAVAERTLYAHWTEMHAASVVVNGVTWSYSVANGKATVTGANPATGSLTIPSTLGGYPVTTIGAATPDGDGAFEGCTGLTSVTIPSGVTCIGYRAFDYCPNLASVKIPSSVTVIRTEAFAGCSRLASVAIPGNATSIEPEAFGDCTALRSITVGAGSPAYSSQDGVLFSKDGKILLVFPAGKTGNYTVPSGVTKISDGAFYGAGGLASVAIPENVGEIGHYAFYDCGGMACVTIRAGGADIGMSAFEGCNALKTLYAPVSWKSKYVEDYWGGTTFWSTYAEVPAGCNVVYGAPRLELAGTERSFTADAANGKLVDVTADVPWSAAANVSWLTVTTASGMGNGRVTYNVAANTGTGARTGTITVTGGGITRTYTVTQDGLQQVLVFDGAGGTPAVACRTNAIGLAYGPFPSATWEGHALLGWFTHRVGGTEVLPTDIVPAWTPRTLFAHWTTEQTVVFDANGGSTPEAQRTGTIGATYGTLPAATRPGYLLLGWYTQADGGTAVAAGDTVTAEATRTLYARWAGHQVTTFMGNGGSPAMQRTTNAFNAAYGGLPEAKRSGHVFLGWFTAPDGGQQVGADSTVPVAAERTLYVHWTDRQVTTFAGNGGTPATQKTTNTIYAAYGAFPAAAWAGHAFLGWFNDPVAGKRVYTNSTVTLAAERTLYAHWKLSETRTTPVAVPSAWLDAHGLAQDSDQGYEAAANGTAANGMKVWECYVAGLDPAGTAEFTVKSISLVGGVPRVEWNPDLNKGGTKAERSYRLLAKKELGDTDWKDVTDEPNPAAAGWRFFRVRVAMPAPQ